MTNEDHFNGTIEPDWQVTATTIYCDRVEHEATIMVYKRWNTQCAYFDRWGPIRRKKKTGFPKAIAWLGIGSEEVHLSSECPGSDKCIYTKDYRDKLYEDEKKALVS